MRATFWQANLWTTDSWRRDTSRLSPRQRLRFPMLPCSEIRKPITLTCVLRQKLVYILTTSDKICTDKNMFWSDGFPTSVTPTQISQPVFMVEGSLIWHMKINGKEPNCLNISLIDLSARKIQKSHLKTTRRFGLFIYYFVRSQNCTLLVSEGTYCGWWRTGFYFHCGLFVCQWILKI